MKGNPGPQPLGHRRVNLTVSSTFLPTDNLRRKETLQSISRWVPLPGEQLLELSDGRGKELSLAAGADRVCVPADPRSKGCLRCSPHGCFVYMPLVGCRSVGAPPWAVEDTRTLVTPWVCPLPLQRSRGNKRLPTRVLGGPSRQGRHSLD